MEILLFDIAREDKRNPKRKKCYLTKSVTLIKTNCTSFPGIVMYKYIAILIVHKCL